MPATKATILLRDGRRFKQSLFYTKRDGRTGEVLFEMNGYRLRVCTETLSIYQRSNGKQYPLEADMDDEETRLTLSMISLG